MNDNYRWRPEWIRSPGWIFAEVPDAVRAELETCINEKGGDARNTLGCLLYTSPSPRDLSTSRMPSSA